jgi:paired amphipathic helix protein Sin3a
VWICPRRKFGVERVIEGTAKDPFPMPFQAPQHQGRPPNLSDALSYLDQLKTSHPKFHDQFLDIMADFKSNLIDTKGVMQRVVNLLYGHNDLIQAFNHFLPPGYRIECGADNSPDAVELITPSGIDDIARLS